MTPPLESEVLAAHQCYCAALGAKMPLTFAARMQWERWVAAGFKIEELQMVLKRWMRQIEQGTNGGVVRLSRICNPETFAEDVMLAHAERKIRSGPRERALESLRPTAVEPTTNGVDTVTAREAMERGIEQMRKVIEGN